MNFKESREKFRSKEISAKELVVESFKKVDEQEGLNIFISKFENDALKQADQIDNNFDKFKELPLGGIPSRLAQCQSRTVCVPQR